MSITNYPSDQGVCPMREAVIVSTARTPIGKAYRGSFNNTSGQHLAAHAISGALAKSGVDGAEVEDVVLGCAQPEGTTGFNVARQAVLRAGLPVTVPGMTVDRQCASGMMAISIAAKEILVDGLTIAVGGGVESISLVQNEHRNTYRAVDPWLMEHLPDTYLPMLHTAENVAQRYGISRERQDEYSLRSQQRTAAAQAKGVFAEEIFGSADPDWSPTRRPARATRWNSPSKSTKGTGRPPRLTGWPAFGPSFRTGP